VLLGLAVARPFRFMYLGHPCGTAARQVQEQGVENQRGHNRSEGMLKAGDTPFASRDATE